VLLYFLFSLKKKLPAEDHDDQGTEAKKAKITLSRNPVQLPSVVAPPTLEDETKAKLGGVNNSTITGSTRGVLKISEIGASAVDKAKLRKEKFGNVATVPTDSVAAAAVIPGAPETSIVEEKLKKRAERFGSITGPTLSTSASGKVTVSLFGCQVPIF